MSRNMRDSPRPSTDRGAQAEATHGSVGRGPHPRGPHATPAAPTPPRHIPTPDSRRSRPRSSSPRPPSLLPERRLRPRRAEAHVRPQGSPRGLPSGLLGNPAGTGSHRRSSPPLPLRGSAPLRPYLRWSPACLRAAASRVSGRVLGPRCLLGGCEAKASGRLRPMRAGPTGWTHGLDLLRAG